MPVASSSMRATKRQSMSSRIRVSRTASMRLTSLAYSNTQSSKARTPTWL
ncbi:hypothetical protein SEA_HANEM_104 [Gordonia phage Hanem]|nr:hypothetical protein SEA_HANEM_104 [Gordonia phage Hanem]